MSGDYSPFSDPQPIINPFKDDAVVRVTSSPIPRLENYNPFVKDEAAQQRTLGRDVSVDLSSPTYSGSDAPTLPINDDRLDSRSRDSVQGGSRQQSYVDVGPGAPRNVVYYRQDNFPPLPACCPLKPCFYQDFDVDIPAQYRCTVKAGYYFWIAYTFMLFLNFVGALSYFIVLSMQNATEYSGIIFGLSILYCVVLTPLSFLCWYRPLYKGFRSDSSIHFFIFFFVFIVQFGVMILACIGIILPTGWVGYFSGLHVIGVNRGVGAFLLIIAGLFTIMAVINISLLSWVLKQYRSTGATFQKAQQEMADGIKNVQIARMSGDQPPRY